MGSIFIIFAPMYNFADMLANTLEEIGQTNDNIVFIMGSTYFGEINKLKLDSMYLDGLGEYSDDKGRRYYIFKILKKSEYFMTIPFDMFQLYKNKIINNDSKVELPLLMNVISICEDKVIAN